MFQYQYKCKDCNTIFDVVLPHMKNESAGPNGLACPICGSWNVRRCYTPVYVSYVGDGFTKKVELKEEVNG